MWNDIYKQFHWESNQLISEYGMEWLISYCNWNHLGIKRNSGMKWDATSLYRDRNNVELWNSIKEYSLWILKWIPLNSILYVTLNGIPLNSMLLNGASVNPMLYWNESFWISWYCMDSQWIIVILIRILLSSMLYWMESHWSILLCFLMVCLFWIDGIEWNSQLFHWIHQI